MPNFEIIFNKPLLIPFLYFAQFSKGSPFNSVLWLRSKIVWYASHAWLAYQTILDLSHKTELKGDPFENCAKYRKGINKGLLKIISKLGISLISSYRGSQLFEIVGLSNEVVDKCFTNTDSRIGGKNFRNLENENRNISLFAKSNISDVSVGGLLKFIHE